MNYSNKQNFKKKLCKLLRPVAYVTTVPLEKILIKYEDWADKNKKEKRYTEKQMRKMFIKMIDYYLYISSNDDLTDNVEGEEAIMLMDEIVYSTNATGMDFFDIEHFYQSYYRPDKKTGRRLCHCRRYQYDEYRKMFKEFCDYGESYDNEKLKKLLSYQYSDGSGRTYLSSFYNDVENVPCYKLTRTRFEEIKKNG